VVMIRTINIAQLSQNLSVSCAAHDGYLALSTDFSRDGGCAGRRFRSLCAILIVLIIAANLNGGTMNTVQSAMAIIHLVSCSCCRIQSFLRTVPP
jgi:hypothetical protein